MAPSSHGSWLGSGYGLSLLLSANPAPDEAVKKSMRVHTTKLLCEKGKQDGKNKKKKNPNPARKHWHLNMPFTSKPILKLCEIANGSKRTALFQYPMPLTIHLGSQCISTLLLNPSWKCLALNWHEFKTGKEAA